MATLRLKDLASQDNQERGTFRAPTLTATITDPEGNVVAVVEMPARAFTPKADKLGRMVGGIGWYGDVKRGSTTYRNLPISLGFRVSVSGVKIAATDTVDIMPESEEA